MPPLILCTHSSLCQSVVPQHSNSPTCASYGAHFGVANNGSEVFYNEDIILDMDIPLGTVVHSETPVKISWADWVHRVCSKMAYGLPQDCAPKPGQRLEELFTNHYMYVQI